MARIGMRTLFLATLLAGVQPLLCQTPTASDFIASVNSAIANLTGTLGPAIQPVIVSANNVYAHGMASASVTSQMLIEYVDGLKQAGAQRIEFNPGVTFLSDASKTAKYDAMVQHIHQLGLQLSINPEVIAGELGQSPTFQDYQAAALREFPQMAERYQPDNFVIVHEPTTMNARLGCITSTVQDYHNFVVALAPAIKAASPRTRVGAGAFQNGLLPSLSSQEDAYWRDFVTIPALDFMTMDIYNDDTFSTYNQWIALAAANRKGMYIEETWAPDYVTNPLPSNTLSAKGCLTESLDSAAIEGNGYQPFAPMDANWLHAMLLLASSNKMEAVTAFATQPFFALGPAGHDKQTDPEYNQLIAAALAAGQLTSTAQAYMADSKQFGIKEATNLSNASYATLPSLFNPNCGTSANPCNANSTVAPDQFVSAFGADLATSSAAAQSAAFPTTLAGSTVTLVDSSNTSYPVQLYSVSPTQVNYLVPTDAQSGPAAVTFTSGDGTVSRGTVLVQPISPGLYTANANGAGPAAAVAVTAHADGSQSSALTFTCGNAAGSCVNDPISLGAATDTVVVELYATGLHHLSSQATVTATITSQSNGGMVTTISQVLYAGPQPQYPGLDQINIAIPNSMAGAGEVTVTLNAMDFANNVYISATSNAATLNIQ
jgi:uncharacterized protein (TIGR03437 family)